MIPTFMSVFRNFSGLDLVYDDIQVHIFHKFHNRWYTVGHTVYRTHTVYYKCKTVVTVCLIWCGSHSIVLMTDMQFTNTLTLYT